MSVAISRVGRAHLHGGVWLDSPDLERSSEEQGYRFNFFKLWVNPRLTGSLRGLSIQITILNLNIAFGFTHTQRRQTATHDRNQES